MCNDNVKVSVLQPSETELNFKGSRRVTGRSTDGLRVTTTQPKELYAKHVKGRGDFCSFLGISDFYFRTTKK